MKNIEINGIKFGELTAQEFIDIKKYLDGENVKPSTVTIKYVPYQPYDYFPQTWIGTAVKDNVTNPYAIQCGDFNIGSGTVSGLSISNAIADKISYGGTFSNN
jgi:hypothetical protein